MCGYFFCFVVFLVLNEMCATDTQVILWYATVNKRNSVTFIWPVDSDGGGHNINGSAFASSAVIESVKAECIEAKWKCGNNIQLQLLSAH